MLSIGFVYILLNPAFPSLIKIGETERDSVTRALELSRQTGVPADYIVLYDELVSDCKKVESILHEQFAAYRSKRNKEFFSLPAKEAIKSLQFVSSKFQVPLSTPSLTSDLLPHFKRYFSAYLDSSIKSINLVLLPSVCFLEVGKKNVPDQQITVEREDIPLFGLREPVAPTIEDLRENEALLKSCDEYTWIMISGLFPQDKAYEIAAEWEKPGGKLERIRADANAE